VGAVTAAAYVQSAGTAAVASSDEALSTGDLERVLVILVTVVGTLYATALLVDWNQVAFFAGRLSLTLFLAGSIWGFGFLILRDSHQDSADRYALELAKDKALKWDESSTDSPDIPGLLHRYSDLVHRHREVAWLRSASATLVFYATAAAGVAGATVLVGIGGVWALGDFIAVMLMVLGVLIYLVGTGRPDVTRQMVRILPGWSGPTSD
jgi:hypothetical protein